MRFKPHLLLLSKIIYYKYERSDDKNMYYDGVALNDYYLNQFVVHNNPIPICQPRFPILDDSSSAGLKDIAKGGLRALLNIATNVDIDVKKVQYPVTFEKRNICVHCGGVGTLKFVDAFGRETRKEIAAFEHIKCTKCGRVYSIDWKRDPVNVNKMYPVAVDPSIGQQFDNFLNRKEIKSDGSHDYY